MFVGKKNPESARFGTAKALTAGALFLSALLFLIGLVAVAGPQSYPPGTPAESQPIVLHPVPDLPEEAERGPAVYHYRLHF